MSGNKTSLHGRVVQVSSWNGAYLVLQNYGVWHQNQPDIETQGLVLIQLPCHLQGLLS